MKQKIIVFLKSEVFRYIFIGICTTAVNFISFTILYNFLGWGLNFANFLGIVISIVFAFFTNKFYVFKSSIGNVQTLISEFLKFVSGRIVTMLLEIFGVWWLVEIVSLNEYISKSILQIIVILSNYFFSKFLVFKNGN